jgi:hypothetical protein
MCSQEEVSAVEIRRNCAYVKGRRFVPGYEMK